MEGLVAVGFAYLGDGLLELHQAEHRVDSGVERDDHLGGVDQDIRQECRELRAGVDQDVIVASLDRGQGGSQPGVAAQLLRSATLTPLSEASAGSKSSPGVAVGRIASSTGTWRIRTAASVGGSAPCPPDNVQEAFACWSASND